MSIEGQMRVAYYLRVSTESQELDNQRTEILPFIDRRGWKLVHTFEDVMSGQKGEKDRPGFAAMLKAAHQRKFDILVFWALDRLTREGTRATLNYLQRLESRLRFLPRAVAGLHWTVQRRDDFDVRDTRKAGTRKNIRTNDCWAQGGTSQRQSARQTTTS
jgi:Resolvase, N terminal domain